MACCEGSDSPASSEKPLRIAPPAEVAPQWGVGRLARHILLCAGPDCCEPDVGNRVWRYLKRRLLEMGLAGNRPGPAVYRTRCQCLRMCAAGPIMVVYPEGAWYQQVDEAAAERILQEHVAGGRIVQPLCFAVNPLPGGALQTYESKEQER